MAAAGEMGDVSITDAAARTDMEDLRVHEDNKPRDRDDSGNDRYVRLPLQLHLPFCAYYGCDALSIVAAPHASVHGKLVLKCV